MGFAGYRLGLIFVHEEVVAKSTLWRHVGFLKKEHSMG